MVVVGAKSQAFDRCVAFIRLESWLRRIMASAEEDGNLEPRCDEKTRAEGDSSITELPIEMELDNHGNILQSCSTPHSKLALVAVVLLVIGSTVLIMACMANQKHRRKSSPSSKQQLVISGESPTDPPLLRQSVPPLSHPTTAPSPDPISQRPTISPSESPSFAPTLQPTQAGTTEKPTGAPTDPTTKPTMPPTAQPTDPPTTKKPIAPPTATPTEPPRTSRPTASPTDPPTTTEPVPNPNTGLQLTTFYVIGDVPYSSQQAEDLEQQMRELPEDAEFLVHVGDLRHAGDAGIPCRRNDYSSVANILRLSHAPVFMLLGDNDWNDCPNPNQGLAFWEDEFLGFESSSWSHPFDIQRQSGRPENFSFQHKGTLFIGLNLVGGRILSSSNWVERLVDQVNWTKRLIRNYATERSSQVGRVVIFGHADPTNNHRRFFNPLVNFIQNELENSIPILYVNGDKHEWLHEPKFFEQPSFLRIMVQGNAVDPPLQITVHADGEMAETKDAFQYDRRLLQS